MEITIDLPKRQSRGLAETHAKKLILRRIYFARKNKPGWKTWTKQANTFAKTLKPILRTWLDQRKRQPEKTNYAKWNCLLTETLTENLEANFRSLSQFEAKLFEQKSWANFEANKVLEIATAKNTRIYWARYFAKSRNPDLQDSKRQFVTNLIFAKHPKDLTKQTPNGLRYLRVGGRGFCLGAGKTRSEKNAWKCRRIPHVRCTLC